MNLFSKLSIYVDHLSSNSDLLSSLQYNIESFRLSNFSSASFSSSGTSSVILLGSHSYFFKDSAAFNTVFDPIDDSIDDPIDDSIDDPIDDSIDDPIDDSIDDPIDDSIDVDPIGEPIII